MKIFSCHTDKLVQLGHLMVGNSFIFKFYQFKSKKVSLLLIISMKILTAFSCTSIVPKTSSNFMVSLSSVFRFSQFKMWFSSSKDESSSQVKHFMLSCKFLKLDFRGIILDLSANSSWASDLENLPSDKYSYFSNDVCFIVNVDFECLLLDFRFRFLNVQTSINKTN